MLAKVKITQPVVAAEKGFVPGKEYILPVKLAKELESGNAAVILEIDDKIHKAAIIQKPTVTVKKKPVRKTAKKPVRKKK